MAETVGIDVEIGADKAKSGAEAVKQAVDGIKGSFLDLSAKVFVAEQALDRVWKTATAGARFEETMGRLNLQMSKFHSTAQLMVNDLVGISNNTLAIAPAAQLASRALGVGLDPQQIALFTRAAMLLKNQLGTDLPTAFDELINAALTSRSTILGNIGIFVDLNAETVKLASATDRTTAQITRHEKAMIAAKAVAEQIDKAERNLSDGMVSDLTKLEQVDKKWSDFWTMMGQGAKTAVVESIDWLDKLGKKLDSIGVTEEKSKSVVQGIWKFFTNPAALGKETALAGMNPQDEGVWQNVLGRAIVSQSQGNAGLKPTVTPEPVAPTPYSLLLQKASADEAVKQKAIQADFDREKASLAALAALRETDFARQRTTADELATYKAELAIEEINSEKKMLDDELASENAFHMKAVKMAGATTEDKITETKRYQAAVADINQKILTNQQALIQKSDQNEAEANVRTDRRREDIGKRTVNSEASFFAISEAQRAQDLSDQQAYYQGEVDMGVARYASEQEMAVKERVLLRDQLAYKLKLSQEEADRIIFLRKFGDLQGATDIAERSPTTLSKTAIAGAVESATAKDIQLAEKANDDFFAGWSRGMQKYVADRDSALGMSADMARRVAQQMETGFQTFFFDAMDGKFKTFKDVLTSVMTFAKQMISQLAAQMVTVGIIKPGATGFGNLFGSGGGTQLNPTEASFAKSGTGFASGGSFDVGGHGGQDTTPVFFRATPGEHVTVGTPGQSDAGVSIVINNMSSAQVSAAPAGRGTDGKQQIRILIRDEVRGQIASGSMDKQMVDRYGTNPKPYAR